MEIFYVFRLNGIENYPAAGEIFLEIVILRVSQTHFSKDFYPKGGINFSRGGGAGSTLNTGSLHKCPSEQQYSNSGNLLKLHSM